MDASPPTCYICNQEGHFARGCTKKTKVQETFDLLFSFVLPFLFLTISNFSKYFFM